MVTWVSRVSGIRAPVTKNIHCGQVSCYDGVEKEHWRREQCLYG